MTEPAAQEQAIEDQPEVAEAAVTARLASRVVVWIVCGVLIAAFLGIDFVTPAEYWPVRGSQWPVTAILLGLCIAQVNLIAAWAALAPGNILLRVSWSLLLGMAMWYALVLGCRERFLWWYSLSDTMVLGVVLLAGIVILQVPLWIAKKRFRWRLTRGADDAKQFPLEDRQFHLRHMFIATFLWALALSPLHVVLPPRGFHVLRLDFQAAGVLLAAIVCNLLLTVPCIWWAFVSTARLVPLVVRWLFYCAALTAIETIVLFAALPPPSPPEQSKVAMSLLLLNATQCVAVFGVLRIFRALGFRLVRFPKIDPRAAGRPAGPLPG